MGVKRRLRRAFSFQRRASCPTVGGGIVQPLRIKHQVGDSQLVTHSHLIRRNTTGQPLLTQSFTTPPSNSPHTPKSASSLTNIVEGEPSGGPTKFKFPPHHRRRFTVSGGMSVRSTKSALAMSNGSLNKASPGPTSNGLTVNGHTRTRHLSTGSSNQSDDPEMSISDITTATNFFDFDENADDLYLALPEEHIFHLRQQEKMGRWVFLMSLMPTG